MMFAKTAQRPRLVPVKSQILSIAVLTAFLDPSNAIERSSIGLELDSRILLISGSPDRRSEHSNLIFITTRRQT
jgi:hypothetical protein